MILTIVDTVEDMFNSVEIFIYNVFSIFPSDILPFLSAMFVIVLALFIYRLVR